jgi:solute carrier family 13 (sodium-dependent dicarboxylate transporter), member 2/3/5
MYLPRPMTRQSRALLAGALAAVLAGSAAALAGLSTPAALTAAIAVLCAFYWVTEPIPLAATALIPFAALPLAGAGTHEEVAAAQGESLIVLLMAGFMLSAALEKSGAHRRIAVVLVRAMGKSRRKLILGFMVATALISAWMSNAATTLMMLPVAIAVVEGEPDDTLATPLFLGVAYAASLGGMATPVGTPPNLIFMEHYARLGGDPYSFLDWMRIGVPVAAILVPLTAWYLGRDQPPGPAPALPVLGPARPAERRMFVIFGMTALLWVFRAVPAGGLAGLLGMGGVGDSTIALVAVALCFILPDGEGGRLLDWPTAARIPWGILLLFGGGIAIADAFERTGLSTSVAAAFVAIADWPTVVIILLICLSTAFLSELASNTALATLLMPILAAVARATDSDPALLMFPAALAASCGFMLPAATAPNAIAFGTGRIPSGAMVRAGIRLDLVGCLVIAALCTLLLRT